jgi:hypothetical protein
VAELGKVLVLAGVAITLVGALLAWGPPLPWLGRLPGDVRIERPGFSFHFPIATSLVISLVLSLLFWLLSRFRG